MSNNVTKVTVNRSCIIKDHFEIWRLLKDRFGKFEVSNTDIINDARDKGVVITPAAMSNYMSSFDMETKKQKNSITTSLSQEKILWLCERYGIVIEVEPKLLPYGKIPYALDNKLVK